MPHIAKWEEKSKCVPVPNRPLKVVMEHNGHEQICTLNSNKYTIFTILEDIISNTLPQLNELDYFHQYVDVKEVP